LKKHQQLNTMTTVSSQTALEKLKSLKPNDGWSIQESPSSKSMKLLRRNVPLSDNTAFLDIHYDKGLNMVVGVLTEDGSICQVLVDMNTGKPHSGGVKTVSCSTEYRYHRSTTDTSTPSSSTSTTTPSISTSTPASSDLSSQDKQLLEVYVKNALMFVAAAVVLKILFSTMLIVLVLPLLYGYLYSTCPPVDSFDAKKQLKRAIRGYHLPDAHPQKPKGLLEEWSARLTATVTTELATLPGYSVEMMPIASAVIWTSMSVPTVNLKCYWIGANHQWYYVGSRELEPTTTENAAPSMRRPHQD
jgi:hypothetical protein